MNNLCVKESVWGEGIDFDLWSPIVSEEAVMTALIGLRLIDSLGNISASAMPFELPK